MKWEWVTRIRLANPGHVYGCASSSTLWTRLISSHCCIKLPRHLGHQIFQPKFLAQPNYLKHAFMLRLGSRYSLVYLHCVRIFRTPAIRSIKHPRTQPSNLTAFMLSAPLIPSSYCALFSVDYRAPLGCKQQCLMTSTARPAHLHILFLVVVVVVVVVVLPLLPCLYFFTLAA